MSLNWPVLVTYSPFYWFDLKFVRLRFFTSQWASHLGKLGSFSVWLIQRLWALVHSGGSPSTPLCVYALVSTAGCCLKPASLSLLKGKSPQRTEQTHRNEFVWYRFSSDSVDLKWCSPPKCADDDLKPCERFGVQRLETRLGWKKPRS